MTKIKHARVAVITRTKDRPLLLSRALASISGQTFKDLTWVVVNDGGVKSEVDKLLEKAARMGINAYAIHHEMSKGMEAASNAGIQNSSSEFIVIHDDDDTWDRHFLSETVGFLDSTADYMGVISHTMRVVEKIEGGQVKTIKMIPFNIYLDSVYLIDVVKINPFPPISFLYKRRVIDEIGCYDESLPVLGDWLFNLKFLEKYDIGVIRKPLANYHFRDSPGTNIEAYGNTVGAGLEKHVKYDAILRNRMLREDMNNNKMGLGILMNLGKHELSRENSLQMARRHIKNLMNKLIK